MKRFFILAILFLSACAPAPTGADPNIALAVAGAQLTGTAQAWSMQQQAWTVTAQSWTPTPSLTPVPTSTPTITPTPTVDVTGTMAVVNMESEIKSIRLKDDQKEMTSRFWAVFAPFMVLVFIVLLAYALLTYSRKTRIQQVQRDQNGDAPILHDAVTGKTYDLDRSPNYSDGPDAREILWQMFQIYMSQKHGIAPTTPVNTPDRQSEMNKLVIARLPKKNYQPEHLIRAVNQLPAGNDAPGGLFPLPAWDLVNGWQGEKNILPFGMTATGLGLVNVDHFPHMATIGKTGEGKSRRFFRPLIACALAAGHRVVVVGKTTDYMVFASQPNMTIVQVSQMTKPEHAARYVEILKALVEEMNRRDDYLTSAKCSTWTHAGRERTFIVLDELGNAMRLMPSGLAEQVRTWVEGLVSEGRKVGFNVAVANQRATGMAGILSQTGKAIFRVESDEEKAHRSLMGASRLQDGYFYARFGDVRLTGAFEPSDEEIRRFLASRPVTPLERDWVDGRIVETFNSLPTPPAPGLLPEEAPATPAVPKSDIEKLAETIRGEWHPDMSGRQVAALLGKSYAGWWKDKTDEIIAVLKNNMPSSVAS